jgi:type IV pilus assembly protein PilA
VGFCAQCGRQFDEQGIRFCPWCGRGLPPSEFASVTPAGPIAVKTNSLAIVSLICGILFVVPFSGIAAIITGHMSRSRIRRSGGALKGSGMAMAGLVLGYTSVLIVPVLIVAAIAIPNLLRAKIAANEASAVVSLRTINVATLAYRVKYGGVPETLAALGPVASGEASSPSRTGSIDAALASGTKNGYSFEYRAGRSDATGKILEYELSAEPVSMGTTGRRAFVTDQTGEIRTSENNIVSLGSGSRASASREAVPFNHSL